jgi:RNA polymerase sigma-70 factor (ECF subfamily)
LRHAFFVYDTKDACPNCLKVERATCFLAAAARRSSLIPKKSDWRKVMFYNSNQYTLRAEIDHGITHYFVSFKDGQAIRRETEVSRPVYLEFLRFVQIERSQRHWDERHREYFDLTEETLHTRAAGTPKSVEDIVLDHQQAAQLQQAIESLPNTQRRRFVLHHEFGLTYRQIAKMEGCSFQAVAQSVNVIERAIRRFFQKQG